MGDMPSDHSYLAIYYTVEKGPCVTHQILYAFKRLLHLWICINLFATAVVLCIICFGNLSRHRKLKMSNQHSCNIIHIALKYNILTFFAYWVQFPHQCVRDNTYREGMSDSLRPASQCVFSSLQTLKAQLSIPGDALFFHAYYRNNSLQEKKAFFGT